MSFKIEKEEFYLGVVFAILGYVLSGRDIILWLNTQTPLTGLIIFYSIFYTTIFILSKFNLVQWRHHSLTILQTFGVILITFSLFIITNNESPYVQHIVNPDYANEVSVVYYQSEDGAVYYVWNELVGIKDEGTLRLLTFSLSPLLLTLLGALLVDRKVSIGV